MSPTTAEGYQQQLQLLGISEDTFDGINRMYLLYARIHDLYTADGSAMRPVSCRWPSGSSRGFTSW